MTGKAFYEDLKSIVSPEHTCLVVWDVQNALVNSIFNRETFLRNLKNLIGLARAKGVRVFYTMISPLPVDFESGFRRYIYTRRYGSSGSGGRFMEPGSPESEIAEDVRPADGDVVIRKNTADIFIGTNFDLMMRNGGIESLVFTGISTEIGVESSARSAGNRGYYPVVVKDCVSSPNKDLHEMALRILDAVCITATYSEIGEFWKS